MRVHDVLKRKGHDVVVVSPDATVAELLQLLVEHRIGSVVVVDEPANVNVDTAPIVLKNGTTVSRTKRRSDETTACTVMNVPSESTTTMGCCAAAKSPTTGMTLMTNGLCD